MSAQEEHDYQMSRQQESMKPMRESRSRLEALLTAKNGASKEPSPLSMLDPIEAAIKNNPGLTREKAAKLAEEYGF